MPVRARFLLVLCALLGVPAAPTVVAGDEPAWTPLFDGRTLDGWVRQGGAATYRVDDGAIVGATVPKTANTFLCTQREFTDFVLELEFKVDPRLNSGVQIRSNSIAGYKQGQVHGYQVEIDPSERAWTAGVYDESRRGWLYDLKDNAAARRRSNRTSGTRSASRRAATRSRPG